VGKIRVVLADDHQLVIANVRRALDASFEVVETVENGQQAIDAVRLLSPDILVIDISMPVLNGLEAARLLQAQNCRTKIVFLTVHEDRDFVEAAFSAGASAYVTKPRLRTDLVAAIREALRGGTFVSDSTAM
jgi:DNA-binding NarL/FixJ family response regulator